MLTCTCHFLATGVSIVPSWTNYKKVAYSLHKVRVWFWNSQSTSVTMCRCVAVWMLLIAATSFTTAAVLPSEVTGTGWWNICYWTSLISCPELCEVTGPVQTDGLQVLASCIFIDLVTRWRNRLGHWVSRNARKKNKNNKKKTKKTKKNKKNKKKIKKN